MGRAGSWGSLSGVQCWPDWPGRGWRRNMLANMPRIPVGSFIEALVVFIQNSFAPLLDAVSKYVDMALLILEALLKFLPPVVLLAIIALIAWRLANRGVAIFTGIGLFLIYNFGLWSSAMETLATVL